MDSIPTATPNDLKRAHAADENIDPAASTPTPTPTPLKKRKIEEINGASPSTPKAINAVASALNGASQNIVAKPGSNALPKPRPKLLVTPTKPRPAIKLAALRGTKWDTGESVRSTIPKKSTPVKTTPNKATPRKTTSTPGHTPSHTTSPHLTGKGGSGHDASKDEALADATESSDEASGDKEAPDSPSTHKSTQKISIAKPAPAPKGILTPTKRRGRPPKSVTFNKSNASGLLFGTPPKNTTPKSRGPRKAITTEEASDEIKCEICARPDSKAPNEIILCDNCDFAVHQECYEVPEIPDGDWLCKTCGQDDILKITKQPDADGTTTITTKATTVIPTVAETPNIPNLDQHLRALQRVLLDRCTGRRRVRMSGQQDAYDKTRHLVEQTIVAGQGNSMLLIGGRGCGKTTLVENIIWDLSQEHRHEFHVVRLNGFIYTDDKLALKEIWRQLGKEMKVEDDLINRTNYADTMASLLALLSHPSEIMGTDEGVTSQSVIFVIDEFDMFAAHPRQTLLYNLFDIAQSRKAPIAVLGCTTRLDVVEMLEKRVKSRFSHRYVYLSPPRTLLAFWHICRQGLMLEGEDAAKEGIDTSVGGHEEFHKYWSHKIEDLYKQRPFQDLIQYHYYTTKSAANFFAEWILPLSTLSASDVTLEVPSSGSEETSLSMPDSRMQLLSGLSELDLGMLIAAARLDIVAHTDTVNFAMTHDEYSSLVGKQRVATASSGMLATGGGAKVWSRGVAGIAWERLIGLGLLVPAGVGGQGARGLGHGGLDSKMWKVDVSLEEIPLGAKLNNIQARWCKEI